MPAIMSKNSNELTKRGIKPTNNIEIISARAELLNSLTDTNNGQLLK